MKKLSIVLPTFNEKDNIEPFVEKVLAQQKNLKDYSIEIVISDSHSKDGTAEKAKELTKKYKNVHYIDVGIGLGVGLYKGHQYALENIKPEILMQLDADGQVDESIIPKLVEAIDQGYNLALGSRFVKGGKNELSFSRRLFTKGSSWVSRILMGPWDIQEFTNSARAFTPELFKKINWKRLPWQEKTFIMQPAFLNEAVLAGAKYKEVPLIFRNRAEGYSKNKTVNYTYDVITYSIEAWLHKMGLNVPFFYLTRRAKTLLKFAAVGVIGTLVDFAFYKAFIAFGGYPPATSKAFSAEIAIINNFLFNNFWTFKYRITGHSILRKFLTFNTVSLGGLVIGVVVVKLLDTLYGDGVFNFFGWGIHYNTFFFFASVPPVLIWNFTVNHFVTWKHQANSV